MATSFPCAQQFSLQHTAPNLSVHSADDSNTTNSITIIGNVHSASDSNISNDLTIIGDVSTSGSVRLDGVIEGNIYCASLIITANGRVNGHIVANQEVTVQGKVTGTIRGRRVMLQSSAKVEGDIFYQGIGIEMGARYDGALRWTEDEHVFDEPNFPAPDKQDNSEKAACNTAKNGGQPKEPQLLKRPTAGNGSRSLAARRLSDTLGEGHPDEMHDRQSKANGNRREPAQRFSMRCAHDDEQKNHREDDLQQESGVNFPGE